MNPLEQLINTLAKVPGFGKKSAARTVFYLLKAEESYVQDLGKQIYHFRQKIHRCGVCGNFTETDPCSLCQDSSRDQTTLCVVEQVQDLMNLNSTGEYKGLFHVLHGVLSPMEGIGPEALKLNEMEQRIKEKGIQEVILATNPTMEGDTTALYIHKKLAYLGIRITRLASGLPVGGDLEYADRLTITRSLKARTVL